MSRETESVLVILTVPAHWTDLPEHEIARKLRANEPALSMHLAAEVKRWAAKPGTLDLAGLKRFVDERMSPPTSHVPSGEEERNG